ncbi:MmgE/PrpD family protein [Variovorax paradoxus]|uniref:MmgE/PrpD family protein n=1 Tax=Variovorax paradoxus TaxID=34073 RepID=UPI00069DD016|nr:MmgE/PrpD family protein [Variovorax paradoxus]
MPKGNESGIVAPVALQLGCHAAGLDARHFGPETSDAVFRCVLDAITSAAAGLRQPGVVAARRVAPLLYGPGSVPIWFSGGTASAGAAMLANSTAAAALDLDDGYRMARGHPGAAVIPAALALMSAVPDASVDDFIATVVAGYEVGVRLAAARSTYAPSGAWSGFAVVAAAGRMLGVDAKAIAQALAIAAQTAPALPALAGIAGSDVKEGIPAGVAAGWTALQLAMGGVTGPVDVLEDKRLFDSQAVLRDLNGIPLIGGTYFKAFGCCRHIHAPLEAVLHLQARHGLAAEDIVSIVVFTYQATFNLSNKPDPATLVEAQYSVPYCLAVCLLRGTDALVPLNAGQLNDAEVRELAGRIEVTHDAAIEPLFPKRSPARVVVNLVGGQRLESPLTDPRGDPERPLSSADLERKLRIATRDTLSPTVQQMVLDGVAALRTGEWRPLLAALR